MRNAITALFIAATALLLFGFVLVYSASSMQSGGAAPFLLKQLEAAAAGLLMGGFCAFADYRLWKSRAVIAILGTLAVCGCLMVFLWAPVNGSRRWISLGGFSLQPSEFARIVMLMALASWYAAIGPRASEFWRGVAIPALIMAVFAGPVLASPDIGATIVMCVGAGTIMLAAGMRWRWVFLGLLVVFTAVALTLAANPNKRARVMVFVNRARGVETTSAASAAAYHVEQSIEAFTRGGMRGRGIGKSIQKYQFLPEANSDFIYAIAAEEFGIAATVSMVLAYMTILVCGTFIAARARDRFGALLALGVTAVFSFEAAFNIGMVTGCLPTKGIALPFASAGGSSLMASMIIVGLLVSIGSASASPAASSPMRDAQIEY